MKMKKMRGVLVQRKALSRVKVELVKSISGPPFTMETELEHSECTSLLEKKTFK